MKNQSQCTISLFPVGNGDMTLIRLVSGRTIMVDCNIRESSPDEDIPDVHEELCNRLERDAEDRRYVDVFLLSHPDQDHCRGLQKYFHLGPPDKWSKDDDKIFIREMWSSPMVFRRASKNNPLCDDAKAFNAEAKRRVREFLDAEESEDGDRILILGEDEDGKTDELGEILVQTGEDIPLINGEQDDTLSVQLLGPLPKSGDDKEEDALSKNNSSVILNFSLAAQGKNDCCRFLTGGDAEVAIWEKVWKRYSQDELSYDILQAPHHCSWHSLSHDSWSKDESPEVSVDALNALSQIRDGGTIVASSEPIKDDDNDPPCIGAKSEYQEIVQDASEKFLCVGEEPSEADPGVMEFKITGNGHQRICASLGASGPFIRSSRESIRHG